MSLVPCIGLAEKIETGKAHTAEVKDYLKIFWRRWSSKSRYDYFRMHTLSICLRYDSGNCISDIQISEPSEAVTAQLIRQLNQYHLNSESPNEGNHIIWTSSDPLEVADVTFSLLSEKLSVKAVEL